jgi:hypothetical protein
VRISDFGRYALSICAAAAFLAGCGGSQPPIGTPGAMPQSHALATTGNRGASWMLPGAKMQDLLYVSSYSPTEGVHVTVFSYPGGRRVGTLSVRAASGLCSDKAGNVYIVEEPDIVEYAHGGTNPIATFDDAYNGPNGCAVDPTTGDLAVGGGCFPSTAFCANVAIFTDRNSPPAVYVDYNYILFSWCTYDNQGNLFANGRNFHHGESGLVELSKGSSTLKTITVQNGNIHGGGAIQWDGTHLALARIHGGNKPEPATIYQLQISGQSGTVVNTIQLNGSRASQLVDFDYTLEFWITNHTIVSPRTTGGDRAGLWQYPGGGNPFRGNARVNAPIYGITVSNYVSRARRAQR